MAITFSSLPFHVNLTISQAHDPSNIKTKQPLMNFNPLTFPAEQQTNCVYLSQPRRARVPAGMCAVRSSNIKLNRLTRQKALLISSGSPEQYYRNIIETTTGVIFIGTPHAGADIAAWVSILTGLAKIAKHTNSDIVEVLKPGSQVLAGLQQEFHRLLEQRKQDDKPRLKIFCIYEELPVSGIGMVSGDLDIPLNDF
jgi:hypothetical protein